MLSSGLGASADEAVMTRIWCWLQMKVLENNQVVPFTLTRKEDFTRGLFMDCTLPPEPYTLHLTPSTLHPTPSTPHPTPYSCAQLREKIVCLSCEDRVLDGPASGENGSKGGLHVYCNPRT